MNIYPIAKGASARHRAHSVSAAIALAIIGCSGSTSSGGSSGGAHSNGGSINSGGTGGGMSVAGGTTSGGSNNGGSTGASASGGTFAAAGTSHTGGVSTSAGANSAGSSSGGASAGNASGVGGASAAGGASANGGALGSGGAKMANGGTSGGALSRGGATSVAGAGGNAGAAGGSTLAGPCDVFASANTPCVAAHSTVRALYASYSGNLYQVRRASDSTTKDIGVLSSTSFADSAAQDAFCSGTTCVTTRLYDQSGHGNHLEYQGAGSSVGGQDQPASATTESLMISAHKVYSLYIKPGNSYWRDGHTTGVPTGNAAEGLYMVTSGTHANSGCCFDYGNSETDRKADGAGAMDAIYFGTSCWFKSNASYKCTTGAGPWVQADLEYGLFASNSSTTWNSKEVSFTNKYVTAMLKNNGSSFALKGGDAQSGALTTLWNGALPGGYSPMKKQGAIVLGSGGDCCATNTNQSEGTFYEGAIVAGYPSDATEDSIQSNIIGASYGH